MKRQNGFTLTELLIAVAIAGILAAITIPRFLNQEAARASEALTQLAAISMGERSYRISNGVFFDCQDDDRPGCWTTMGIDNPASGGSFYTYEVMVDADKTNQFCAVATRNSLPNNSNVGQTICLDEQGQYSGTHPNSPNPHGTNNTAPKTCETISGGIC